MKKQLIDFEIESRHEAGAGCVLLKMRPVGAAMPQCEPGQFVEILVDDAPGTLLRRPISICDVADDRLWLLVKDAGPATHALCEAPVGKKYSVLLPLGRGFWAEEDVKKVLLVGGGVGTAPLLYWGKILALRGVEVSFLIGARKSADLLLLDELRKIGSLNVTTEDGSEGVKGMVTAHPALAEGYDLICSCGPLPMMKAIAAIAKERNIDCQVSLENKMACGLGACLCCVEDTTSGNRCVCQDGPVYNINELKW